MLKQTAVMVEKVGSMNAEEASPLVSTVIPVEALLGQGASVAILHAGEVYLLTRTRLNKLLLTKQHVKAAETLIESANASRAWQRT